MANMINATVMLAGGARGPQPLPSPYPAQSGYTQISALSQITPPAKYQLASDDDAVTVVNPLRAGTTVELVVTRSATTRVP